MICTALRVDMGRLKPASALRYPKSITTFLLVQGLIRAIVDCPHLCVYSELRLATGRVHSNRSREPPGCVMNLPNSLTILRIFFIPVLVVILLTREPNIAFLGVTINFAEWGVLILLAAAATDWADGYYARRRSEVTTLGILLDPIADKLLMSAAFISLVEMHLVQGWMAVIIIGREIVVLGLRNIASAEGFTIPASALGKTKMVLQVIAVCAVILAAKHTIIRPLGVLLLWLVVGSAVVSAFQYFQKFWGRVDGSVKQRRHLRILERRKNAQDVPTVQ